MNRAQKVIKYVGISFAVLLIIGIFGGITLALFKVGSLFLGGNNDELLDKAKSEIIENIDFDSFDIDVKSTNLVIAKGEENSQVKIETNNKYIEFEDKDGILNVIEKRNVYFGSSNKTNVVITLPSNLEFKNVTIKSGVGTVHIEEVNTDTFNFNLGAGSATIDNLIVRENAKINGGAGEVTIANGLINNLDLDLGVGNFSLTAIVRGKNEINAGIGEVLINFLDSMDNYTLTLDKGIGDVKINDEKIKGSRTFGDGINTVDVDGGIGEIRIKFLEEDDNKMEREINLDINGMIFKAVLEDNATSMALLEMLPIELKVNDLNSNEKYVNLDKALPKNEYYPKKINSGDIMLYGSDTLVIFYEDFDTSYSYTRIGRISDVSSLKESINKGNVIKISK